MTSKVTSLSATFCCVPGCDSDTFKKMDSSITLHKFPQDPRQSVKWIQEINSAYKKPDNAPQWFPTANSVICSKHFQATDFSNDVLKSKAVPTIFINRTDQPTCAKQVDVSKVSPAVTAQTQEGSTLAKVKPNEDIKDILARASDLFNKNMAIAKSLEGTMPAPSEIPEENKGSVSKPPVSPVLPELNLDMSLADLQSKLNTPAKEQTDVQMENESTPTNSKLASTPMEKTQVSGKRKLEDEPQYDFIKIGENKYLKIQRVPASGTASTSLANKNEQSGDKCDPALVDMLTKNCSASEKQNVIDALNKYNMSQPISINNTTNSTAAFPKMVTSNGEGKLEIAPQSEFIKIGDGKYLKISRVPTNANKTLNSSSIIPSTAPVKKPPISGAKGPKNVLNKFSKGKATPKNTSPKGKAKNINLKGKNNLTNKKPKRSKNSNSDSEDEDASSSESDESSDEDLPTLKELKDVFNTNVTATDSNVLESIDKIIDEVAKSGPESESSEQPETNNSINESPTTSFNFGTPKKNPSIKKEKPNKKYKRSYFKFGTMPMFRLSLEEENGLLKSKIKELEKRSVMPINQQTALERENIILKKEVEKLKKEVSQSPKDNLYKKLKAITEESGKGDASATYILDQINSFQSKVQKFSNSTYLHCALLCRKNAQAYELFRKAELFRLPTFNTVDRYIRRHPNMNLSGQTNPGDMKHGINPNTITPNKDKPNTVPLNKSPKRAPIQVLTNSPRSRVQPSFPRHNSEHEMSTVEVDTSNSELREVVLETGEVVQCYASDICVGEDGHQYFIMREDHSNSHSHHSMTHSQDVYVPNAAGQLQYTETEVAIATGMIS